MLNRIKRHFVRLVTMQANLRVIPHSRPGEYNVYTTTDKGPWNRIYTGPLDEERAIAVGWAHRETPWEAFVRICRTFARWVRALPGRVQ